MNFEIINKYNFDDNSIDFQISIQKNLNFLLHFVSKKKERKMMISDGMECLIFFNVFSLFSLSINVSVIDIIIT